MKRILIAELSQHIGERVMICGFLDKVRDQKKRQFLIIRDQSNFVQALHEKEGRC